MIIAALKVILLSTILNLVQRILEVVMPELEWDDKVGTYVAAWPGLLLVGPGVRVERLVVGWRVERLEADVAACRLHGAIRRALGKEGR